MSDQPTLSPEARALLEEAARLDHTEEVATAAAVPDPRVYAVVEIMGHRTRAGAISDASLGGCALLRIEHPTALDHDGNGPLVEFYAPSAIFSVKPCSRQAAEAYAASWWRTADRPSIAAAVDAWDEDDEDVDVDLVTCRICGCTDEDACVPSCSWVPDPLGKGDLCSACLDQAKAEAATVALAEQLGPEPAG